MSVTCGGSGNKQVIREFQTIYVLAITNGLQVNRQEIRAAAGKDAGSLSRPRDYSGEQPNTPAGEI